VTADALFDLSDLIPAKSEPVYSVHCFFNCGHVTSASDPHTSSAAMEQHYGEEHTVDIDRALGFLGGRS
jgi:hypothetical protein